MTLQRPFNSGSITNQIGEQGVGFGGGVFLCCAPYTCFGHRFYDSPCMLWAAAAEVNVAQESGELLKVHNVMPWVCRVLSSQAHRKAYADWPFSVCVEVTFSALSSMSI